MSDEDDSGPLSYQAKKRKIYSRSALNSDLESMDVEKGTTQSSISVLNSKEELDTMIAELRAKLNAKRRENQQHASGVEMAIDRVQSTLSRQEHEYRELEARLDSLRDELVLTRSELSNLGKSHKNSKAATSAKEKMLAQAATDVQELETLAKELPVRLHQTAFGSKDASMMTMLRSFHRDILQKHFGADGTDLQDASDSSTPASQQMDEDTKGHLDSVLRGLRVHKSYPVFAHPVTPEAAVDYLDFIKHPIDLSTIRRKLESGQYRLVSDFVGDAKLMFMNCRTYNGAGN